jgi:hypothetical protein
MYFYDYILYHAHVAGVSVHHQSLPAELTFEEILLKNNLNISN